MLSFFPLDVLDEIWDLIESVSEGFLTYSFRNPNVPISVKQYLPTTWQEYSSTSQNYLDITPTMTSSSVKQKIRARKMFLWLKLLPLLLKDGTL